MIVTIERSHDVSARGHEIPMLPLQAVGSCPLDVAFEVRGYAIPYCTCFSIIVMYIQTFDEPAFVSLVLFCTFLLYDRALFISAAV